MLDPLYVQSSLDLLGKACEEHPHLRVKIAVDCVDKGYASHHQAASFLGLELKQWLQFYCNFKEGDLSRVPKRLQKAIPPRDLPFFAGFTDEQLEILERALELPFLIGEGMEDSPLFQELRVLVIFGVVLSGRHNQFKSYRVRLAW